MKKTLLTLAVLVLASSAAFADTQYNNTSSVTTSIGNFGNEATQNYGETFLAPVTNTTLNDFSLFLNASDSSGQLEGFIGTWTDSEVGSILYTSSPVTVTGANQEFTFDTGGLSLTGGEEYVAFISASEPGSYNGMATMPGVYPSGSIPGGTFVYLEFGAFTNPAWSTYSVSDAEFVADFSGGASPTPEPSSLLLLGTGLVGLAGALRRKFAR